MVINIVGKDKIVKSVENLQATTWKANNLTQRELRIIFVKNKFEQK